MIGLGEKSSRAVGDRERKLLPDMALAGQSHVLIKVQRLKMESDGISHTFIIFNLMRLIRWEVSG